MFDSARMLPPGLLGVYLTPGGDGQGLLGDKPEGGLGGYRFDLVAGLAEAPDHAGRLVRSDATRNAYKYFLAAIHNRKYIPLR